MKTDGMTTVSEIEAFGRALAKAANRAKHKRNAHLIRKIVDELEPSICFDGRSITSPT